MITEKDIDNFIALLPDEYAHTDRSELREIATVFLRSMKIIYQNN